MVTERETGVEECVAQAWAFLAQSDEEFASGDTRQGAEKLYGAASQVVIAAAKQRGWQHRSHRANKNTVTRLSDEYGDPFIAAGFITAEKFHVHFFHENMEDYEIGCRSTSRSSLLGADDGLDRGIRGGGIAGMCRFFSSRFW